MKENVMKIAMQGIAGCFHHEAARQIYGDNIEMVECHGFGDVFDVVDSGVVERGIVGIENSLQGSINQVYRLLARKDLYIVGEVRLKVGMYLIGSKTSLADYSKLKNSRVYSMNLALAQVEQWLDTNMPNAVRIEYYDNAASVKHVVESGDICSYAVAGKTAAELYGGKVLAGPINDDRGNYTRFFVVSKTPNTSDDTDKTSVILTTDNTAGSLYRALGVFDKYDVSLAGLNSYPIAGDDLHYMFYVDYMCGSTSTTHNNILKVLEQQGCSVRVLGSYKSATM
jgi:prephenate dehydratase